MAKEPAQVVEATPTDPSTDPSAGETTPKTQAADAVAASLESLKQSMQSQHQENQVLFDPDVQKLIDLKKKGIEVNLVPQGEETSEVQTPKAPDVPLSELSGDQLQEFINQSVAAGVAQALPELVKTSTQSTRQDVESLMQWARGQAANGVQTEATAMRAKYQDFDKFETQMVALSERTGNSLGLEELYVLAKTNAGSPIKPNTKVESEVPSGTPPISRVSRREDPGNGENRPRKLSGRAGFRQLMSGLQVTAPERPGG